MASSRHRDKKGTSSACRTKSVADPATFKKWESWLNVLAAVRQVEQAGITDDDFQQIAIELMRRRAREDPAPSQPTDEPIGDPTKVRALEILFAASWQLLMDWAPRKDFEQQLTSWARKDLETLCSAGCNRHLLVMILSALRDLKDIEASWTAAVGSGQQRRSVSLSIHFDRRLASALIDEGAEARAVEVGRLRPGRFVSELRFYRVAVNLPRLVAADNRVRSLKHVLRLMLAGYVKATTGKSRHGAIAGIIAEVCSEPDYTQDAQREWRKRNAKALDDPSSLVFKSSGFLRDLTKVLMNSD